MQEFVTIQDVNVIKYLIAILGFLIVSLNSVLMYFFKGIHKMVKKDHELLKSIATEHRVFHKEKTGIT